MTIEDKRDDLGIGLVLLWDVSCGCVASATRRRTMAGMKLCCGLPGESSNPNYWTQAYYDRDLVQYFGVGC